MEQFKERRKKQYLFGFAFIFTLLILSIFMIHEFASHLLPSSTTSAVQETLEENTPPPTGDKENIALFSAGSISGATVLGVLKSKNNQKKK